MSDLGDKVTLPCGLVLPNRQAPMSEVMADTKKGNLVPLESMYSLYRTWAKGGWGLIITGNVMVDGRYFITPEDVAIDSSILSTPSKLAAWKRWAQEAQSHGTPALLQINHPGRQSAVGSGKRGFMDKTIAPSPVALNFGSGYIAGLLRALLFGTPREMTERDMDDVVERFVLAARVAKEAGFKGVEIHAAHGYLLAQFLNPKTNKRTDSYGATPENRAALIMRIIRRIREVTGPSFAIGIKLNSTDYQQEGAKGEADLQTQVKCIVDAGIDFIEISGGTFENMEFWVATSKSDTPAPQKASTALREAYFLSFASSIRSAVPTATLMVTGGFRSRSGMRSAVTSRSCDLIGLARPAVLEPSLPMEKILKTDVEEGEARIVVPPPEPPNWLVKWLGLEALIFSSKVTSTYGAKMKRLASGNTGT